jgi:hypothetical protein
MGAAVPAKIRRLRRRGRPGKVRSMTRDSPATDLWAWLGAAGASEGAPRHSRAAAVGSSRSGEGAARSGLHACRVCRVGARQGTGVVGEASEGTPGDVPRRQPR